MRPAIKKERIFRVLALQTDLTPSKISVETALAKSYVSKVLAQLRREKVIWGTAGIQVDYEGLIRRWADLKKDIFRTVQPLVLDVLIPERLKAVLGRYAISGLFAELLVQGESPGRPLIVYLTESEMARLRDRLISLGTIGRGLVWIYAYDEHILSNTWMAKGWRVVSIPQLCADIIALGTYADLGIKIFRRWLSAGRGV